MTKEATARIKINKLLEAAGWRFFPEGNAPANIRLEPSVTIKSTDLDALGENFEKTEKGLHRLPAARRKGLPAASSSKPRRRTRIRSSARSRPASTPGPRTAASSSSPTATCTTSGISSAAIPTSSRRFPTPDSVTGYQKVTPESAAADRRSRSATTTSSSPSARTTQSEAGWKNEAERPATSRPTSCAFCGPTS